MRRLSRMRKMRKINAASENGANRSGFSLMEMMVVLLIMSIIMAASAPIVSRKMSKSAAGGASPWVYTGTTGNIAYNMGGKKVSAIIGAAKLPSNAGSPRLYIDCGTNSDAQIAFGRGNEVAKVIADPQGWKVGISNATIPQTSVAFGGGQTLSSSPIVAVGYGVSATQTGATAVGPAAKAGSYGTAMGYYAEAYGEKSIAIGQQAKTDVRYSKSIAIGYGAHAYSTESLAVGAQATANFDEAVAIGSSSTASDRKSVAIGSASTSDWKAVAVGNTATASNTSTVAIGDGAKASNYRSIAIGGQASYSQTKASGSNSIAIGSSAEATSSDNIAIGNQARASGYSCLAIGPNATASNGYSVAIGYGAKCSTYHEIVLGTSSDVVYIPGDLVVAGDVRLNTSSGSTWLRSWNAGNRVVALGTDDYKGSDDNFWRQDSYGSFSGYYSDKRLKNLSGKYTSGLEALKKLDLYHYTYKFDSKKTPHVGVTAQDLAQVFPDAVTIGKEGYLMIRTEDMFFAVINAVKELDTKIASIIDDITGMKTSIKQQEAEIIDLQNRVAELEKLINKTK